MEWKKSKVETSTIVIELNHKQSKTVSQYVQHDSDLEKPSKSSFVKFELVSFLHLLGFAYTRVLYN